MLSFGATKNGAMAAEAVLGFRSALAAALGRRRKRAGPLFSKMRFLSAQLEAYLAEELWLRLAARANHCADLVAAGLAATPGVEMLYPVDANEVFARIPDQLADELRQAGYEFHRWPATRDVYRLVASFDMQVEDVEAFVAFLGTTSAAGCAPGAAHTTKEP